MMKDSWNKYWESQLHINIQDILNSRFTQEAYHCLKYLIDDGRNKLVLEAGCGTGRFCCLLAKDYPNSEVVGIDISPNSLKIANFLKKFLQISNVIFEMGNLFHIPYPDNYFDVVFNEGVIEHFSLEENPNYKDALKEMIRVAKPKGKIVVGVPNWYCLPHTFYKWILKKAGKKYQYGYEKSFKESELKNLFSEFGLQEIIVSAFYPSHGFYRLSGTGFRKAFYILGKLTDLVQSNDHLFNKYFIKKFGFEIVAKGIKP